jgi:hypothetical protein
MARMRLNVDEPANLNRQIIEGNVRRRVAYGVDLNEHEIQKAVDIGLVAFTGNTGNGKAADIGIEAVRKSRR